MNSFRGREIYNRRDPYIYVNGRKFGFSSLLNLRGISRSNATSSASFCLHETLVRGEGKIS